MVAGVRALRNPASVREVRVTFSESESSWPRFAWFAVAAVVLVAVWAYAPTVGYPLLFDDRSLIDASGPVPLGGGWLPYRPVRHLSYLLDASLGGSPALYHAHNVLLHALCAASAAAVAMSLGASSLAAALAVSAAAVHPSGVEVVAYIAGRRDLLVSLGILLSVLSCLRGFWGSALVLAFIAAGAKETGLLSFGLLALTSWARFPDGGSVNARSLLVATSAAVLLVVIYGASGPWAPGLTVSDWAYAARVGLHYTALLLGFGAGSLEHSALLDFSGWASAAPLAELFWWASLWTVPLSVAGLLLVRFLSAARAGLALTADALVLAWALFVFVLLAFWGGLHEPGADRHLYPLVWLASVLLAVSLPRRPSPRALAVVYLLPLIVAFVFAFEARALSANWSSSERLWSTAFALSPGGERAGLNYAAELAAAGRLRKAAIVLSQAQALRGDDPAVYEAMAVVACRRERPAQVRKHLADAWRSGAAPAELRSLGRDCGLVEFQRSRTAASAGAHQ